MDLSSLIRSIRTPQRCIGTPLCINFTGPNIQLPQFLIACSVCLSSLPTQRRQAELQGQTRPGLARTGDSMQCPLPADGRLAVCGALCGTEGLSHLSLCQAKGQASDFKSFGKFSDRSVQCACEEFCELVSWAYQEVCGRRLMLTEPMRGKAL